MPIDRGLMSANTVTEDETSELSLEEFFLLACALLLEANAKKLPLAVDEGTFNVTLDLLWATIP